eukprot:1994849-Karenia_brevis.AAC.1
MATSLGKSSNKFLDMFVSVTFNNIIVDQWHSNHVYAVSGDLSGSKKCRFPPYLGNERHIIQKLAQNMMSKRARWQQLQLEVKQVVVASLIEFYEMVQ